MMRYDNVTISQTTNRRVVTSGCVELESVNIEVISAKADVHKAPQGCIVVGSEFSLHVSEEALPILPCPPVNSLPAVTQPMILWVRFWALTLCIIELVAAAVAAAP